MPYVSQRGRAEAEKFLQSIVEQSDKLKNWELGNYTLQVSSSRFGNTVTMILSLHPSKPTGSQTSGRGGKAKAGTGAGSGSRPGKGRRGGADRD